MISIKTNKTPSEYSLKILTSAYVISKLDYCNSIITDIPKLQEKSKDLIK